MGRLSAASAGVCAVALLLPSALHAQATAEAASVPAASARPSLSRYLQALGEARLAPAQSASARELQKIVAAAERLYLQGSYDDASILLFEAVESPRFNDFRDFAEYAAAEHMLGSSLTHLGALSTARHYLERVVARGPRSPYYGPGLRAYVDVALRLGDLEAAATWLAQQRAAMTEDAQGELSYLRARATFDAGKTEDASALFEKIGKRSRFYGNAQYFLGVIATRKKQWKNAERRFCAIASQGVEDRYSFYVDERFFSVQDLARLALGRTAHEQHRGDDAFYYYFQVPEDSPRLARAMFEAAYSAYESKDNDNATDLLDQLEARFPQSAVVDEAGILRGYVSLARCDFERADKYFAVFAQHFAPLLAETDRLLANPLKRESLYEELLAAEAGKRPHDAERRTLLALLHVDPEFYRLEGAVRDLDAEAARDGRLSDSFSAILVRLRGQERPRTAAAEKADSELDALERDLALAVGSAQALAEQLDALRAAGANAAQLAERDAELGKIAERVQALRARARLLRASVPDESSDASAPPTPGLVTMLTNDVGFARSLPRRTAEVRARLVTAASERAEQALRELRARLFGLLQRARIGRIDAVMGSKRRIEVQIESLAAGRFPAELRNPLSVQGLLNDDEEYWPFEGEDWPDEYKERYGADDSETDRGAP